MGFVDGPNVYTYVRQNPWSKFDPEGLQSWTSFSALPGVEKANPGLQRAEIHAQQAASVGMVAGGTKLASMAGMTVMSLVQGKLPDGGAVAHINHQIDQKVAASFGISTSDVNFKFASEATELAGVMLAVARAGSSSKLEEKSPPTLSARATAGATEAEVVAAEAAGGVKSGPARMPALQAGEEAYQLKLLPDKAYSRTGHYGNTPTVAQRASVPPGMEFDHNPTLVKHYYEGDGAGGLSGFNMTQNERLQHARSLSSGSAATPTQQRAQGGAAAQYSKEQKKKLGL
jgi:hypothetical protein